MIEQGLNWMTTDDLNIELFRRIGVRGRMSWRINGQEVRPRLWNTPIIHQLRRVGGVAAIRVSPDVGIELYLEGILLNRGYLRTAVEEINRTITWSVMVDGSHRIFVVDNINRDPGRPVYLDARGRALS